MATDKKTMTAEELLTLPEDDHKYELLDGVLVKMSPPGGMHGHALVKTSYLLLGFVETHGLGVVLGGDPGVILRRNPDRVRAPDVCFIARDRIPASGIPSGYLEIVPDFIIEINSPNDRPAEVQEKAREWIEAGARLVWTMDPATISVRAYQADGSVRMYVDAGIIDAAPVLSGFRTAVRELFS